MVERLEKRGGDLCGNLWADPELASCPGEMYACILPLVVSGGFHCGFFQDDLLFSKPLHFFAKSSQLLSFFGREHTGWPFAVVRFVLVSVEAGQDQNEENRNNTLPRFSLRGGRDSNPRPPA